MNGKIAFLVLLLCLGAVDALWVSTDKGEYMPLETVHLTVSEGKGVIIVDVLNENGENAYHATRAAKQGETTQWGYTYYYPEEFNISLKSGRYDVEVRDDLGNASTAFDITSIGIAAVVDGVGKGVFLHKENGAAIEGGKITLYYNRSGTVETAGTTSGTGGYFSFDTKNLTKIVGEYESEKAEIEIYQDYYGYYPAYYEQYSSYVFSDKTLYQPGETAHISSVILLVNESAYETVTGPFEVTVRGPDYNVLYSTNVSSVNSRVSFDFPIEAEAALGYYSVEIRRNESSYAGYYSFQVQEYKRPEIKLELTPQEKIFELNKTMKINVSSDYYFGGAADAEVHFEIDRSPYYWPLFRCGGRCIPPYWGQEKVAEGLVYTKNGVGEIDWGGANQTGDYTVKAWATDESQIQTESETTITVLEKVNLDAIFSEMNLNESGLITVLTYDKDEKPLDLDVNVKIYSEEWNYPPIYYAESAKTDVAPVNEEPTYNRTLVFEKNITTAGGQESFEFTPHQYGNYVIVMESGEYKSEKTFYVSEYGWWNSGSITVELDKTEYAKGETMNMTVTSPTGGKLFVVAMGATPSLTAYSVTPGINSIQMPAVETSSLEFFLVDEGKRYSAYANYVVRGNDWVKVDIASNGTYRPGDAARLVISATRNGVNSNAAASIAIVDQSIIDLSKADWNDIYTNLYGYPRAQYQLLFSWDYYGGVVPLYKGGVMVDMAEEALPAVPGQATNGGAPPSRAAISIRQKFPETAFWIPYFMIEDGKKEIIWHIPDTLTTWNVTVVANEGANVGMGTSAIIVTKDVIGRMSPPPALVEDDAAAIPVTVFNYGKERKTFTVTLEASKNIEIIGSPKRYVSIEPDSYASMDIPVKAIGNGTANFTLWVEGGEGDAVFLPIEVKPLGVEIIKGESGLVDGTEQTTPVEVKYATPNDAEVKLSLYSSVLSSAFGSLDYLVSYPYGCIEQTMSGFLPTVVLLHTTQQLGLNYTGDANISGIIDDGLVRIYSFQNADGSWGWFRGSDERITAYVMDGLRVGKESGVVVDEGVYSKGEQWLAANANSSYGKFVLNRLDDGAVTTYSGDAFGALTQCEDGKCDALLAKLQCTAKYCSLSYDGEMDWYHDETELTSYAVSALVKNGKMEEANKCVNWLMLNKKRQYWVSTKDTAISVLALSSYAKETGELKSDYIATVSVDSGKVLEERLGYQTVGTEEVTLPAGWHTIQLQRDGFGPLYYTLTQRYYSMDIPKGDWKVSRSYDKTIAKVGDEITVTLKVNGTGQYVAIEDPIPLGTEIVKQSGNEWMYYGNWWYGGYRMEARQDRAVFFFDRMDSPEITYKLRVTHKGDFTALPTHAYNMYAEEVGGYSDFQHFTFYEKARVEPYVTEFNTTLRVYWEGPGPAEMIVKANGAEQTYTVQEGQNDIVVNTTGPVEYAFKSDSEYYEGEAGKSATSSPAAAGNGGTQTGTSANYLPLLAVLTVLGIALIAVYFWKKK